MKFNYNTKQRNNTIQGLRSFKDTLPTKVKRIIVKKGKIYSETLDNWRYIVGNDLFKCCYPKYFKSSNRAGDSCLNIMVKRGHEVEIEYSKKNIINKVNSFFGYEVVKKIKLNTFEYESKKINQKSKTYISKSKYSKKISTIKNDKIKKSLTELEKLFKKK